MTQILHHFMKASANTQAIDTMIQRFQLQGWEFITVITEGNRKLHGYVFQKSTESQ